jgi:hypothetical protein
MISHCTDYARRNYLLAIASRGLFRAIFTRRLVFSIYTLIMQSVLDYSNVLPTRREEMWWREKEKYQPGINSNYIWSLRSRLLGRHVLWDSPNRPLRPVRQSRQGPQGRERSDDPEARAYFRDGNGVGWFSYVPETAAEHLFLSFSSELPMHTPTSSPPAQRYA